MKIGKWNQVPLIFQPPKNSKKFAKKTFLGYKYIGIAKEKEVSVARTMFARFRGLLGF